MTYEYDAAHEADMAELRREQLRDDCDDDYPMGDPDEYFEVDESDDDDPLNPDEWDEREYH